MSQSNGDGKAATQRSLTGKHLADLKASGLTQETIAANGLYSIQDAGEVARVLNWDGPAHIGRCLAIPFRAADGTLLDYIRLKPDKPRTDKKERKPVKYESPKGSANHPYFPVGALSTLADPSQPLVIAEGDKKALAATQFCFPCIGLVGVYGWQRPRSKGKGKGKKKDGPRELVPELAALAWEGREIFLCFDSDILEKEGVRWAEWHLAEVLEELGADVRVVRLPGKPVDGRRIPVKIGLDDFLVAHGADAFRELLGKAGAPARPSDDRPEVVLDLNEHTAVEKAVAALAERDPNIYQRGGQLVRVMKPSRPPNSKRIRASGSPRPEPIPEADLRLRLTKAVRLLQVVESDDGAEFVPTRPTEWLIKGAAALGKYPEVRHLEGVIDSPVLRPDGTILDAAGYDPATCLLYEPTSDFSSRWPDHPTRDDAVRARDALLEVVCDFPFASEVYRAAWLAATLTPLARFAYEGPTPWFIFDGNTLGVGKGLLADTIAQIVAGRDFARASYAQDNDEMGKIIVSLALAGERLVLLDNLSGPVGKPNLNAVLTATE